MFAIAFDLNINDLRSNYNDPYNNAYYEIKTLLRRYDFYNTQGSVYLTENNDMSVLFSAINALKEIDWFRKSVRDIRAFRVEDWSDFTQFFKVWHYKLTTLPPCMSSNSYFSLNNNTPPHIENTTCGGVISQTTFVFCFGVPVSFPHTFSAESW